MDKVFIAWSRNVYQLALSVAQCLRDRGYMPVVGGQNPEEPTVHSTIHKQMDDCSFAIVLAKQEAAADGEAVFRSNTIYELGYLSARLDAQRMLVAFIDLDGEIPSDLQGRWRSERIFSEGKKDDAIASIIADKFTTEKTPVDKMAILANWRDIKRILKNYGNPNPYTELDTARYVLFSDLSSYWQGDSPSLLDLCERIQTESPTLKAALAIECPAAQIYTKTQTLRKPLSTRDYDTIRKRLSREKENEIEDENLRLWARVSRLHALSFAYYMSVLEMSIPEGTEASKDKADMLESRHMESIRIGKEALKAIDVAVGKFPADALYASLMKGLQYRNIAISNLRLGNEAEAVKFFRLSSREREAAYFGYMDCPNKSDWLGSLLAQEYYLAQLELCDYDIPEHEKAEIRRTVKDILKEWKREKKNQTALIKMMSNAYKKAKQAGKAE